MAKKTFILLFTFVVVIVVPSCSNAAFEYFKLVQQWPTSFCNTKQASVCPPPIPHYFTIHGLWPDNYTRRLNFCSPNNKFNLFSDQGFLQRMQLRWPDLKNQGNQVFWEQQWRKHGTCSANMYPQQQYLDLALHWKDQFDLLNILGAAGVSPGSSYSLNQLIAPISATTTKVPDIRCNRDHRRAIQLSEIVICIDTSGTSVINCPGQLYASCPTAGRFPFP